MVYLCIVSNPFAILSILCDSHPYFPHVTCKFAIPPCFLSSQPIHIKAMLIDYYLHFPSLLYLSFKFFHFRKNSYSNSSSNSITSKLLSFNHFRWCNHFFIVNLALFSSKKFCLIIEGIRYLASLYSVVVSKDPILFYLVYPSLSPIFHVFSSFYARLLSDRKVLLLGLLGLMI